MSINGAAPAAVDVAAWSAAVFATLDMAPPEPVLGPVLARGCITLLGGKRGVGKSWLALAMAHAAASGTALFEWQAPRAGRVVYVDAAMGQGLLQARLRVLAAGAPSPNLVLAPGDAQAAGLPDVAIEAGRAALDRLAADADLVVLDGLSALLRTGRGIGARWAALADWLRALRRRGLAVLLVEASEPKALAALADTVLRLERPAAHRPEDGLRAVLDIAVARGLSGAACRRRELLLSTATGIAAWTCIDAFDHAAIEAWLVYERGLSVRQTARKLGLSTTATWRLLQRAKRIDPKLRPDPAGLPDEDAPAPQAGTAERAEAAPAAPASAARHDPHPPPSPASGRRSPSHAALESPSRSASEPSPACGRGQGEGLSASATREDNHATARPPETAEQPVTMDDVPIDELLDIYLARRRSYRRGLTPPPDRLASVDFQAIFHALRNRLTGRVLNGKLLADDGGGAPRLSAAERLWRTPQDRLPYDRGIA